MEKRKIDDDKDREAKLVDDVIKAEVLMCEVIVELNLTMNDATTLTKAVKQMFPDSAIASKLSCAKTKTTAIVKKLGALHKDKLLARMKNGPFSLSTDGSNDSNSKQYPIVVRTLDPETLLVSSEVVELPILEDRSTGKNIFALLDSLLKAHSIPWSNCISFGCDNTSVNTGVHKGVFSFIKEKNPDCLMSGCTLHLVHLAAEKAAHQLPYNPADLLIDIYYYMQKSSVRQGNLKKWQQYYEQEERCVLKHVVTRWLSIGRCITMNGAIYMPFLRKRPLKLQSQGQQLETKHRKYMMC